MGSVNDITDLFAQPRRDEIGFRQGRVLTFNTTTKENTIDVGGTILTNIEILGLTGPDLLEGDIVGLLRSNTTYFILGRIITPPI